MGYELGTPLLLKLLSNSTSGAFACNLDRPPGRIHGGITTKISGTGINISNPFHLI